MPSARVRHLRNAPIKEALIDLRVTLPDSTDISVLQAAVDAARSEYPAVQPLRTLGAIFDLKEERLVGMEDSSKGFILWNAEHVQAVQFRLDGFTLNRLKPYEKWSELISEAARWWQVYLETARPESVTRIALKYINRLLLPESDFTSYLTRPPARPLGIKGKIPYFLYQVRVDAEAGVSALITQTVERGMEAGNIPFILDIEAFEERHFDPREQELFSEFGRLHDLKNDIFFESLTEEAIRLCE